MLGKFAVKKPKLTLPAPRSPMRRQHVKPWPCVALVEKLPYSSIQTRGGRPPRGRHTWRIVPSARGVGSSFELEQVIPSFHCRAVSYGAWRIHEEGSFRPQPPCRYRPSTR